MFIFIFLICFFSFLLIHFLFLRKKLYYLYFLFISIFLHFLIILLFFLWTQNIRKDEKKIPKAKVSSSQKDKIKMKLLTQNLEDFKKKKPSSSSSSSSLKNKTLVLEKKVIKDKNPIKKENLIRKRKKILKNLKKEKRNIPIINKPVLLSNDLYKKKIVSSEKNDSLDENKKKISSNLSNKDLPIWIQKKNKNLLKSYNWGSHKISESPLLSDLNKNEKWEKFSLGLSFNPNEIKADLVSLAGFKKWKHKKFIYNILKLIADKWFYDYLPIQALFIGTLKFIDDSILVRFDNLEALKKGRFQFLKKDSSKIHNQAVEKALLSISFNEKETEFEYRNLDLKFTLDFEKNEEMQRIIGTIFLYGEKKKKKSMNF